MSGIGDGPSEGTRKKSRLKQAEETTESKSLTTLEQEYEKDFDHMLDVHGEHHESLAGRLNSRHPDSLSARHFALRVLHWQAHEDEAKAKPGADVL